MKSVAGTLRLDLAQYRELEAFAKFGSDLDKATLAQLTRGERMVEILKQNQYVPMSVEKQTAIIYAASRGHLDDLEISEVGTFENELLEYLDQNHREVLESIVNEGKITKDNEEKLDKSISNFKKSVSINDKVRAYLSGFNKAIFFGSISAKITIRTDITMVE